MAEPTAEEIAEWRTIQHVADWAGLTGDAADEDTPLGSLLLAFGATAAQHFRVLGAMLKDDFTAVVQAWQPGGHRPTPVQLTSAALLGVGARIACGTQRRAEVIRAEEVAAVTAAATAANALALAKAAAPPPLPIVPLAKARVVKMSTVIAQSSDQEVGIIDAAKLRTCYTNYQNIFGQMPPPGSELTSEQLSGLDALLTDPNQPVPYLDYSVWGPHHHRLEKRMKLQGQVFDGAGKLRPVEIAGPPTPEVWQESHDCAKTGFIMFDAISLGNLDNYAAHFMSLVKMYGQSVWYLAYQTEVRMRQERMEVIRRRGESEHAAALAAGGTHAYNPLRPWDWVWAQSILDHQFWKQNFEAPALLVLTRTQSLSSMIDGDVVIKDQSSSSLATLSPGPAKRGSGLLALENQRTPKKQNKGHQVKDGKYTANRAGALLCPGFQTGVCNTRSTQGTRCGVDSSLAHQCAICLSPEHGASSCGKGPPPAQSRRYEAGHKGGGKGKGKKGKSQY